MTNVSVIIRTKNEEFWIARCLTAIKEQVGNFNVEIIIVDNKSTDCTIDKALQVWPDAKILTLEKYNPSVALNLGVGISTGQYCLCISAHCVPENDNWIGSLIAPLADPGFCASYGRQIPLKTSAPNDKRDLWLTFGLDDVIQAKDPFLHNANSAYRRSDLVAFPFDERLTNIEDRSWGLDQINRGLKIFYSSVATVYHDHGIHQTGSLMRLNGVIGMMDIIHDQHNSPEIYYGKAERFTTPSKLLLLMVSDKYGDQDIKALEEKFDFIKSSFVEWKVICMPTTVRLKNKIEALGFVCFENRIQRPESYGNSLIDDISLAVNELADEALFWDLVAFFDVRNDVPTIINVQLAEHTLMTDQSDFVFGGQRTFIAEDERDCGARHILNESGWIRFFKTEKRKSIIELTPSRLLLAKSEALRNIAEPFQNYSVIHLDD